MLRLRQLRTQHGLLVTEPATGATSVVDTREAVTAQVRAVTMRLGDASLPTADPRISSATFSACYLFDVADTIDLKRLENIGGQSFQPAPLSRTIPTPEAIQFAVPPRVATLSEVTVRDRTGSTRAKIYDYGVISIGFTFPYAGSWSSFIQLASDLRADDTLPTLARERVQTVLQECGAALVEPHEPLVEDYFINTIEQLEEPRDSQALLDGLRSQLVRLMLAETGPLSQSEESEALRFNFSYFPDDLVVVQWDSAFIFDSHADAEVVADLLEFANSQLVEFRTYDARLDAELDVIYAADFPPRARFRPMRRRGIEQRAAQLSYLMVDIRELADRATNALKITGDAYYARIYRAIAARLGLDVWQRQIESKLDAVGDVYRYLVDEAQVARSEFLELIVIVLIGIEIVVGILGLRH